MPATRKSTDGNADKAPAIRTRRRRADPGFRPSRDASDRATTIGGAGEDGASMPSAKSPPLTSVQVPAPAGSVVPISSSGSAG